MGLQLGLEDSVDVFFKGNIEIQSLFVIFKGNFEKNKFLNKG